MIAWAAEKSAALPELKLLYHVPNGGYRPGPTAVHLKAEGVKPGVPDLHLPVARGDFHSLYIEMKAGANTPTDEQKWWHERLTSEGHLVVVAYHWETARDIILAYLDEQAIPDGKARREKRVRTPKGSSPKRRIVHTEDLGISGIPLA